MRYLYSYIKRKETVLSVLVGIISVIIATFAMFKTKLVFQHLEVILTIVVTLIIFLIAYISLIRIKHLENQIESGMDDLKYQTKNVQDTLLMSISHSQLKAHVPSGFEHLQDRVEKFVRLYSYDKNVALLSSYEGLQSEDTYNIIKSTLADLGFRLFRASDQQITDDNFSNVVALFLGCRYGIALFEPTQGFPIANPNVAFELGIMLSLGRRVLILKDSHIQTLPMDIIGHIYQQFEHPSDIPFVLKQWLSRELENSDRNDKKINDK